MVKGMIVLANDGIAKAGEEALTKAGFKLLKTKVSNIDQPIIALGIARITRELSKVLLCSSLS